MTLPESPSSTVDPISIPSKTSSKQGDDAEHNRTKDNALTVEVEGQQPFPVPSFVDDFSPTSIYTTESEMPFDEKGSFQDEDIQQISQKAQYITNTSSTNSLQNINNKNKKHSRKWGIFRSRKKQQIAPIRSTSNNMDNKNTSDINSSSSSSSGSNKTPVTTTRSSVCPTWTWFTEGILHAGIKKVVVWLSTLAATHPITCLVVSTLLSLVVLATGFFTNFQLIVDTDQIFTPLNSLTTQHYDWLLDDSGFNNIRAMIMIIHANGDNVLGQESLERLFEAVDTIQDTKGYDELCQQGSFVTHDNIHTCRILSATRFWNHNKTLFEQEVTSDAKATALMSQSHYRDSNTPVFHEMILGNYKMSNRTVQYQAENNTFVEYHHQPRLHFVQSLFARIELPDVGDEADYFEERALERLKQLKHEWNEDDTNPIQLDFLSIFAYKIENQRAIIRDLPLIMGIFLVLVIFTTLVFTKRHPVYSRSMLGIASLLAVGMSLCLSYGIMWCIGVPFTNIAQILPFMIMGVGLDDTFIITGAYFRTNPSLPIVKRVEVTMDEVGLSISLTTITTMTAFLLGSLSTIPGVRWLCFYAFTAMFCDFLFQITFFVSLLVLDERRLQAYRRNCCFWKRVPVDIDEFASSIGVIISSSLDGSTSDEEKGGTDLEHKVVSVGRVNENAHFSERVMIWYSNHLMKPLSKMLVLIFFAAYFGFCCYRTTLLTQEFNVEDYTPADSYLRGTLQSLDNYYSLTKPLELYFRDVDQSDPSVQEQMRVYVDEMAALPQIGEEAPFCWVQDLDLLEEQFTEYSFVQNLTFDQQLKFAMANPTIREVYGEDIVINEDTGEIEASRCLLFLRNVDLSIVNDQIAMLEGQREVTQSQPINQARENAAFFAFDRIFFYWELYAQAVNELTFTIVSGVVAVTLVTFVLIPHWSAIFFVAPGIIVMYLNFLGTMQWMGLHINSLTYVIICMAIGLLVDFLVHILLRYYEADGETREAKIRETLRTMGASMFVGGLTTFLGVCPLVLSTTHIFMTVFWAFAAMVILGFTHGLILLPVVLSLTGPIATHHKQAVNSPDLHRGIEKEKGTDSSSSPSSNSSGAASKFEDEILENSSEEELEELTSGPSKNEKQGPEKAGKPEQVTVPVPFLGPSYDLEMIEECAESTTNRPDSAKSARSRQSILQAPSDEITITSPRELSEPGPQPSSLLGQLPIDVYNCGADFDFFDAIRACQVPKR